MASALKVALPSPIVVVAAALRDDEGRLLVQQRPAGKQHAGLWEFPGGKVEAGEAPPQALARELCEELAIEVAPESLMPFAFAADRRVILLLYRCSRWMGEPVPRAAAALRWAQPAALLELAMPPLDVPLVRALLDAD